MAPLAPVRARSKVHAAGDDRAGDGKPDRLGALRPLPAREARASAGLTVARLRLAPSGETMFPPRAPFFKARLAARREQVGAGAEEKQRGNLPVSPYAPSPAHRRK